MSGRMLGVSDSANCQDTINYQYLAALVTQGIFTANRISRIVDIRAVPQVAGTDGSAVTLSFYKCASGTAPASGVLLHAGTYNMKGTIYTQQVLTLVANLDTLTMNPGDTVAYVLTGTATAAIGCISITIEPV